MRFRFLDGSIDMLDKFMMVSASSTDEISHLHNTGDTGYIPNRSADPSASEKKHANKPLFSQTRLPQPCKKVQLQDSLAAPATPTQHLEIAAVPVLHKDKLSYQQFAENFMQPNLPVMIRVLSHSVFLHL